MTALRHHGFQYAPTHYQRKDSWDAYAGWLRTQMRVSLALAPEPPQPELRPEVHGKWAGGGYTCEKVNFETLQGFHCTGNLFRPEHPSRRKLPVILCPHGHWEDGRLHDRGQHVSVIARCAQLARMGAIVLSHDMVGYNDSCQTGHNDFPSDPATGLSLMAVQTWNSIRCLDFLLSLPDADPSSVGVTGASGGGTQSFVLAAVDPRVTVSAPICMVSYSMQGGCQCENAPLLRLDATNVDIARLFAPKPQFLGSCSGDWTRDTESVELPALLEVYRLHGRPELLGHHNVDTDHNYNQELREHVYGFFNRHLFGSASTAPMPEAAFPRPPHRNRMVWWGRPAPPHLDVAAFRTLWKERLDVTLRPHLRSAATAKATLVNLLPFALGVTPFAKRPPHKAMVAMESDGGRLKVHPLPCPPPPEGNFDSTYNLTPFAKCVSEIVDAVAERQEQVDLEGCEGAGFACLAAAALCPQVRSLRVDLRGFDPEDSAAWVKHLDTPAIRQIGGLSTLFAALGGRALELVNATAPVLALRDKYAR